jgi:hypothetical protein
MNTPATNNTIAFLMASNNEDIAQDLANEVDSLKRELERANRIATERLELLRAANNELALMVAAAAAAGS